MKVLVDARMLRNSGIGVFIREVLCHAWLPAGAEAVVLVRKSDHDYATGLWGTRYALQMCDAPVYSVCEHFARAYWAVKHDADVIWSPHYTTNVLLGRVTLTTIHDCAHLALPGIFSSLSMRIYARVMMALAVLMSERIQVVSSFTARELRRFCPYRVDREFVVPNGVSPEWREAVSGPAPAGKPYILYIGNVKPHKNLRRCVEAFAMVAGRMPHVLKIAGAAEGFITGDPQFAEVTAPLGPRVEILGWRSFDDLRRLVAGADFLIFPSLYEGFGLPVVEAMVAGCPVVASDIPSIREVAADAVYYFDPMEADSIAAAIMRVGSDAGLREELSARGLVRSRLFCWEKTAAGVRECLHGLQWETII